jgi:hypothetical protein
MTPNQISATLSKADRDRVLAGFENTLKLMPFLCDLSAEQRQSLFRVGDKSLAFIRKAREAALAHSEGLPRQFDDKEFQKDVELVEALYPILMAVRHAADLIEDTYALAASEAYASALVVYRSLRDNDPDGAFAAALDDLSARFERKLRGRSARSGSKPSPHGDKPQPAPAP